MSPFNDTLFSKGPTMVLPNQHNPFFHDDTPMGASDFGTPAANDGGNTSPSIFENHSTTWTPSSGRAPVSTNPSRKRSRDETSYESVSADGSYFPAPQAVSTPAPIPEEEPIYGEGMVLLNPKTGRAIAAESQTGTWYEERNEAEAINRHIPVADEAIRPEMTSRKSQRLHALVPKPDDLAQAVVSPDSPTKSAVEPAIDDFTISLGIGWTGVASEDPDLQAAARGWAKYIDNHYAAQGVHGAKVLSKSKGLNAYLVGAQEGFFLFSDDLLEGRMIGTSWERTIINLRSQPMVFDGTETLKAVRTPSPEANDEITDRNMINGALQNGVNGTWSLSEHDRAQANGMNTTTLPPSALAGGMEID